MVRNGWRRCLALRGIILSPQPSNRGFFHSYSNGPNRDLAHCPSYGASSLDVQTSRTAFRIRGKMPAQSPSGTVFVNNLSLFGIQKLRLLLLRTPRAGQNLSEFHESLWSSMPRMQFRQLASSRPRFWRACLIRATALGRLRNLQWAVSG